MYVNGFVLAVPENNRDQYRHVADAFWDIIKDYGALSQIECWEADVPDGKVTDFRRAVKAEDGEKIVFSWVSWPDRATADKGNADMMEDDRIKDWDMPFDGKRMIWGGFETLLERHID